MNTSDKTGRVRVMVHGESYTGAWRVEGLHVVVTSSVGEATAALGGLVSAPGTVALEKLTQMVKAAHKRAPTARTDQARFNVREAYRRY